MEPLYLTKVVKVGTANGVVIPTMVLYAIGLQRGDAVVFGNLAPGQFTVAHLPDDKIKELKMLMFSNPNPISHD